jgi:hypothetical protein
MSSMNDNIKAMRIKGAAAEIDETSFGREEVG